MNYNIRQLVGSVCFVLSTSFLFTACKSSYVFTGLEEERIALTSLYDNQPSQRALTILTPYKIQKDSIMNAVIGVSEKELLPYRPESPLSNLAVDVLREAATEFTHAPVDVAVTNMGGLRNSLPAGHITIGAVYEVFPFENHLCILTLKGATLQLLLKQIISLKGEAISGVRAVVDQEMNIKSVRINDEEINPERLYTVATLDFLAEGNDGMTAFLEAESKECYPQATIREIMIRYVEKQTELGKEITGAVDGRITIE